MQPSNQKAPQLSVDARLRMLFTIWFALLVSIGLYYALIKYLGVPNGSSSNGILSVGLATAGTLIVAASIPLKQRYLKQAVDNQRVEQVPAGYILAWALCEVPALLGLLDQFVTRNRYYYALFILALGGMLLHFPRRQHLLDASFKSNF